MHALSYAWKSRILELQNVSATNKRLIQSFS